MSLPRLSRFAATLPPRIPRVTPARETGGVRDGGRGVSGAATKPSENLRRARELMTPEGAWTQGALARDAFGRWLEPQRQDACSWCSMGSLLRVASLPFIEKSREFECLFKAMGQWPPDWQDRPGRTQAEVLAAFDAAIVIALAEGW